MNNNDQKKVDTEDKLTFNRKEQKKIDIRNAINALDIRCPHGDSDGCFHCHELTIADDLTIVCNNCKRRFKLGLIMAEEVKVKELEPLAVNLLKLLAQLADISFDENSEVLDQDFYIWKKGEITKEEIWHYLEKHFNVSIGELLNPDDVK